MKEKRFTPRPVRIALEALLDTTGKRAAAEKLGVCHTTLGRYASDRNDAIDVPLSRFAEIIRHAMRRDEPEIRARGRECFEAMARTCGFEVREAICDFDEIDIEESQISQGLEIIGHATDMLRALSAAESDGRISMRERAEIRGEVQRLRDHLDRFAATVDKRAEVV